MSSTFPSLDTKTLQSLQDEVKQVGNSLKRMGQKTYKAIADAEAPVADAVSRAYDARQRQLMHNLDQMKKQAHRGKKRFLGLVRAKPLQVVGAAVGAGLLLGLASFYRSRK